MVVYVQNVVGANNIRPYNIRRYYDHIIRNQTEINSIADYIQNNPYEIGNESVLLKTVIISCAAACVQTEQRLVLTRGTHCPDGKLEKVTNGILTIEIGLDKKKRYKYYKGNFFGFGFRYFKKLS